MKKLLSILLITAVLFSLLAGCGTNNGGAATASPSEQPSSVTPAPSQEATPAPAEAAYPICEPGAIQITYWFPLSGFVTAFMKDLNENPIFVEMEKTTGVHINWIHPAAETAGEQFNLLFVSGDLPDMMKESGSAGGAGQPHYASGPDQAIKDGYYVRLNEYLDKSAPNFSALIGKTEPYRAAVNTDEGNIWGFGYFRAENARVVGGLGYRRDVFEKLGIDTNLELISQWDQAFATLKENGNSNFLMLDSYGLSTFATLLSAWETAANFLNKDGTVVYGPATSEFKAYLKQMAEWYQKGYISKDLSAPAGDFGALIKAWGTGETLVGTVLDGFTGSQMRDSGQSNIDGFYLAGAHYPRLDESKKIHNWNYGGTYLMSMTVITTACENVDAAIRWCDYFYTDEGFMLVNYGVEGKSYEYDSTGKPMLNDFMIHNEDGVGVILMMFMNCFMGGIGIESTAPRFDIDPATDHETQVFTESAFGSDWNMPASRSMTAEESSEYSTLYTDLSTYVSEYTYKAITGTNDIDSTFDSYVDKLNQMKLQRAIELQQSALDRYLAR